VGEVVVLSAHEQIRIADLLFRVLAVHETHDERNRAGAYTVSGIVQPALWLVVSLPLAAACDRPNAALLVSALALPRDQNFAKGVVLITLSFLIFMIRTTGVTIVSSLIEHVSPPCF